MPRVRNVVRECRKGRNNRKTTASARFLGSSRSRNRRTATGNTRRPIDSFAVALVRRRKLPKSAMKRPATNPPRRRPAAFTPSKYATRTVVQVRNGKISWTWTSGERPPT